MSDPKPYAVQIAARLYECRDAMRSLWKDTYREKIAAYQGYIATAEAKWKLETMEATMRLVKELQERNNTGMQQALLFAAYVELIEPSDG